MEEKKDEGLGLTCAVASAFALMASITGLLDGVQDVDEGCQQGMAITVCIRTFCKDAWCLGPLRKKIS